MRGQEPAIVEICVALSEALQSTCQEFEPLKDTLIEENGMDVRILEETIAALTVARESLLTLGTSVIEHSGLMEENARNRPGQLD